MKAIVQRLYTRPIFEKVLEWGKLITITGSAQSLIQLLGLVSGILIIRVLSTEEYALYTLANTMLGTMTVLSDGGISAGVMAQGGKVWQNKEKLGQVLVTGLELRKKFGIVSLLITSPVLVYLLLYHGASWIMAFLIVLSLIPAFFAALSDSLLEVAPKLHQDISPLQRNSVAANIGRLLLIGSTVFIFPWSFIAIIGGGIPRIWANWGLRKIAVNYVDYNQPPDPEVKEKLLKVVRRILPGAIYYCLSGQVTIWLISVFGSTESIAKIGALGRLAVLFNLFNVLFATLVVPRFARLPDDKGVLFRHFFRIQAVSLILCAIIIIVISVFSSDILFVLGPNYSNLTNELVLNLVGNCFSLLGGISYLMYTSRGWVMNPLISISISIMSIALGSVLINVSTLHGVLMLNIFIGIVQALMHGVYCLIKILNFQSNISRIDLLDR